jgi:hypothetical protein
MRTPGFTAEASVYKSKGHYTASCASGAVTGGGSVIPSHLLRPLRTRVDDGGPGADVECLSCMISCCTGYGGVNRCWHNWIWGLYCGLTCCDVGPFGAGTDGGIVIA